MKNNESTFAANILAVTQATLSNFLHFGKTLLRDWAIKSWFIFPPHLNSVSALPGKTQNQKWLSLKCSIRPYCFPRLLPIVACFFSPVDSQLTLILQYKSCNQWCSALHCWVLNSAAIKLVFFCSSSWTVLHAQCNDVVFPRKTK